MAVMGSVQDKSGTRKTGFMGFTSDEGDEFYNQPKINFPPPRPRKELRRDTSVIKNSVLDGSVVVNIGTQTTAKVVFEDDWRAELDQFERREAATRERLSRAGTRGSDFKNTTLPFRSVSREPVPDARRKKSGRPEATTREKSMDKSNGDQGNQGELDVPVARERMSRARTRGEDLGRRGIVKPIINEPAELPRQNTAVKTFKTLALAATVVKPETVGASSERWVKKSVVGGPDSSQKKVVGKSVRRDRSKKAGKSESKSQKNRDKLAEVVGDQDKLVDKSKKLKPKNKKLEQNVVPLKEFGPPTRFEVFLNGVEKIRHQMVIHLQTNTSPLVEPLDLEDPANVIGLIEDFLADYEPTVGYKSEPEIGGMFLVVCKNYIKNNKAGRAYYKRCMERLAAEIYPEPVVPISSTSSSGPMPKKSALKKKSLVKKNLHKEITTAEFSKRKTSLLKMQETNARMGFVLDPKTNEYYLPFDMNLVNPYLDQYLFLERNPSIEEEFYKRLDDMLKDEDFKAFAEGSIKATENADIGTAADENGLPGPDSDGLDKMTSAKGGTDLEKSESLDENGDKVCTVDEGTVVLGQADIAKFLACRGRSRAKKRKKRQLI